MKVAILSGKGGTGKTTVATNLAYVMNANYMDCDVEEPNGHLFLKPQIEKIMDATMLNPRMDENMCTHCGLCAEACQFNALAVTKTGVLVFNELCHGCGVCRLVCPNNVVKEYRRRVGEISIGTVGERSFISGKLDIKEPMGVPIISKLHELSQKEGLTFVDCSPGTSCTVVEALEGADYAVLVTEPTRFGIHDLNLAIELLKDLHIPHGVIVNRSNGEDKGVLSLCAENNIPLIGQIPFDRNAAVSYSKGNLISEHRNFRRIFEMIGETLLRLVEKEVQ